MKRSCLVAVLLGVLVFCSGLVCADGLLTKMEFQLSGLSGISQLDNTDGVSVNLSVWNSSGVVVSRTAAAGIYLPNMTVVMTGPKFTLDYARNYTLNMSTVYGDFLYNFTTPASTVDTSDATAAAGDILSAKTAYVAGSKVTGTMLTQSLACDSAAVNAGYYAGTTLNAVNGNLSAGNIKSGVNVFGVVGSFTDGATAGVGDILSGKTAYAGGSMLTGSMPTQTLVCNSATVGAGYYAATTLGAVNSNLTAANVKSGVGLFGVMGSFTDDADAGVGDILSGKTAYVAGAKLTGSLATQTLACNSAAVNAGYYAGTTLDAVNSNLSAGNVKPGVNLFGVVGTFTSDANATASDILPTQTAYVNGVKLTGSMPMQVLACDSAVVGAGYYAGTTLDAVNSNLSAANIKPGVNLFGVTGSYTSDSNATAGQILATQTAYVNGAKLTGTMPTQALACNSAVVNSGYYVGTTLDAVNSNLTAANVKSGVDLFGVTGTYTSDANASAGQILATQTAYVAGAKLTGTMPTQALACNSATVNAGYYAATALDTVNSNLSAANIKKGVDLFGVTGSLASVQLHTGENSCYDGSSVQDCPVSGYPRQDAELDGTAKAFVDNLDGTVTDPQTGLMWQQVSSHGDSSYSATCYDSSDGCMNWQSALQYCAGLSLAGHSDWHLPNFVEMATLIDFGRSDYKNPALTWGWDYYWTSTSLAGSPVLAYGAGMGYGDIDYDDKSFDDVYAARCVRPEN